MTSNSNQEIDNLETFYLIWFGNSIANEIQEELRAIINYLLIFEDAEKCLQYIQSRSKDDRIILIINEKLSQPFIPRIIHLQQIISIYIFSNDKKLNEQWTKNFKKIKGIITRRDELLRRIQADYNQRLLHNLDDVLPIRTFNTKMINMNDHFIHLQILFDCLTHMEVSANDRNELIIRCKQQYQKNPSELNIVEEFERNYSSEQSLWWYTRHSFLSRIWTKAVRIENMELISLFQFFIRDIKQQLKRNNFVSSSPVYRAQYMYKEDLQFLTKFIGEFISITSFLSTCSNREQTRSSLLSSALPDEMEKVFIEINTDQQQFHDDNMFRNITSDSYSPKNEQVLFMIGSIFRLVCIDRDADGIWNIQLILWSNKDHQLQSSIREKEKELNINVTDHLSLGFLFEVMSKLDDAEQYYCRLLKQLSEDHEDTSRCYHALGEITQRKSNYDSSIMWYNKALQLDIQMSKVDDSNTAISHNSIAVVYSKKGDYMQALKSYEKALKIWKKISGEDHPDVAMCLNNIGIIYQEAGKYSDALECYHKAWNIRQRCLSIYHPHLGQSHICIGNIHYHLRQYDLALDHYSLSLEIFQKSLPSHHPNIAMVLRNIGLVYRVKGEFQQALSYLKKAAIVYRQSFSSTQDDVMQIEQIIQCISSKL